MDLKSLHGYNSGSPYASNPYLDINSPTGEISMENTPIDLAGIDELGNVQFMRAYNKKPYKFPGKKIREIPMKQRGGYSQRELVNYIFDDNEDEQLYRSPEVQQPQEFIQEETTDLRAEYDKMLQEEINNQLIIGMSMQEDYVRRPSPYGEEQSSVPIIGMTGTPGIDPRVQSATNELLQKFPKLKITSTIRNWGDKDAHPKGRAIDLAGEDVDKAWDYYSKEIVPKYGFNKALNPKHGTWKHIHVGYYQKGGPTYTSYQQIEKDNKFVRNFLERRNADPYLINNSVVARDIGDPIPQFVGDKPLPAAPKQISLPFGITVDHIVSTTDGYGYYHPQYGNFVPVDASSIYSSVKKSSTAPLAQNTKPVFKKGGAYRKLR